MKALPKTRVACVEVAGTTGLEPATFELTVPPGNPAVAHAESRSASTQADLSGQEPARGHGSSTPPRSAPRGGCTEIEVLDLNIPAVRAALEHRADAVRAFMALHGELARSGAHPFPGGAAPTSGAALH